MLEAISDQNNPEFEKDYGNYAGIIYIAKYLHLAHKEDWDEEKIVNQFPNNVATKIGMNTEKAFQEISATHELESGLDALLDG